MDAVVFAVLVSKPGNTQVDFSVNDVPKAKFRITNVVKGGDFTKTGDTIETIFFGDAKPGDSFMVMGVDPPGIMWSTPLLITPKGKKYLDTLPTLPVNGVKRLEFFQDYFEDSDEMLARDAYDEFAKAPYDQVVALKSKMSRENLIGWINDPNIPASRKRLYLTMLGVCGLKGDLPFLESLMKSDDRQKKAGLDAMIACYLAIKGPDGMPLIENLFLKNKEAEYADTYAAIAALRFHGSSQSDIIPKDRLVDGLEHMLTRPKLADLVIPDLARWEDWEVMDELVTLFKTADEKSSWVRVPVVNYLRACPLPAAKLRLKELEKIDPDAIRRANTFFPLPASNDSADSEDAEKSKKADEPAAATENGSKEASDSANSAVDLEENTGSTMIAPSREPIVASFVSTKIPQRSPIERTSPAPATNSNSSRTKTQAESEKAPALVAQVGGYGWILTLIIPTIVCSLLFLLMWGVLTGNVTRLTA